MPTAARLAAASLTSSLVNHSLAHSVPQCKELVASFADFEEEAADRAAEQAPIGRQHVPLPPGCEHPDDPARQSPLPLAKEVCHTFRQHKRMDLENWTPDCPRRIVQRLWCPHSGTWPAETTIEAEWLMGSTAPGTPLRQGIGSCVCDGTVEEVAGNTWGA